MSNKKEINKIIPEIDLIKEEKLKHNIIRCWEEAIKKSTWDSRDISTIPFAISLEKCPVALIQHIRAVTNTCSLMEKFLRETYGDLININRDYLIAGALLHDIGKLNEYKRERNELIKTKSGLLLRHPYYGLIICANNNIPDEVLHLIATHSFEGEGQRKTIEAKILHHADFLNFDIFCDD